MPTEQFSPPYHEAIHAFDGGMGVSSLGVPNPASLDLQEVDAGSGGRMMDSDETLLEREYDLAIERMMTLVTSAQADNLPSPVPDECDSYVPGRETADNERGKVLPHVLAESEPLETPKKHQALDKIKHSTKPPETHDQLAAFREVARTTTTTALNKYLHGQLRSVTCSLFLVTCIFVGVLTQAPRLVRFPPAIVYSVLVLLTLNGLVIVSRLRTLWGLTRRRWHDR